MVMPSDFVTLGTTTSYDAPIATGTSGHQKYSVVNRPTCLDLPIPLCERAVSTVLCVSTKGTKARKQTES